MERWWAIRRIAEKGFCSALAVFAGMALTSCMGVGIRTIAAVTPASTPAAFKLTDDKNTPDGFLSDQSGGKAQHLRTQWDAASQIVRLDQTSPVANPFELDASWAPQWSALVSYWPMNGSFNDAVGTHPATATNGATFTTPAKLGTMSGLFDGTNDYADIPAYSASWSDFSVCGWYNKTAATGGTFSTMFATNFLKIQTSGGTRLLVEFQGHVGDLSAVTDSAFNLWNHFCLTRIGSGIQLYLNGQKVSTSTRSGSLAISGLRMGYDGISGLGGVDPWLGKLDEFAVWTAGLTDAEVQTLYSRQSATYAGQLTSRVLSSGSATASWTSLSWKSTLPFLKSLPDPIVTTQNEASTDYPALVGSSGNPGDDNLMMGNVALWHLDEIAGTSGSNSIVDASGRGSNLAPTGPVGFERPSPLGRGIRLNSTSMLSGFLSGVTGLDDGIYTLAMWVNFESDSTAGEGALLATFRPNGYIIGFEHRAWGGVDNIAYSLAYADTSRTMTTYVPIGKQTWHHLAAVSDRVAGTIKIYVDGQLASSNAFSGAAHMAVDGGPFVLNDGMIFTGRMDEVGMWDRALHPKEIAQLYRRGANRLKFQVRHCTASDCSDDPTNTRWKGVGGTGQTFFSELYNSQTQSPLTLSGALKSIPEMLFANFTSPPPPSAYLQYRALLESDDASTSCDYGAGPTWCSPELKSVTIQGMK